MDNLQLYCFEDTDFKKSYFIRQQLLFLIKINLKTKDYEQYRCK